MRDRVESFFYEHMYGDDESVTRPLWLSGHAAILLATALVGDTFARGDTC